MSVSIKGPTPSVEEIAQRASGAVQDALEKGVLRAALEQEAVLRRVISDEFPSGRTGQLRRSFKARMLLKKKGKVSAGVFSSLVYAGIQDRGGVIKAKRKFLAIPLKRLPVGKWPRHFSDLFFIRSKKGNAILARQKGDGIEPVFVLKRRVTLRGRDYIDKAKKKAEPAIREILEEFTQKKIDGAER